MPLHSGLRFLEPTDHAPLLISLPAGTDHAAESAFDGDLAR